MAGELPIEGAAPPAASPSAPAAPSVSVAPPLAPVNAAPAGAEPVVSAPAAPATPGPFDTPTLLETATDKLPEPPAAEKAPEKPAVEVKPVDAAKPDDKKVEAAKPEPEKVAEPEAPVEYTYEFPEHVKPDEKILGEWNDIARTLKATPEQARAAVGIFNKAAAEFVKAQVQSQIDVWNKTQADWVIKAKADPFIGGANWPVSEKAIARGRDAIISDATPGSARYEREAKEFNEALRITGAGNNLAIVRAFKNAARFTDEPRAPSETPKPSPSNGARPNRSLYGPSKAPPGVA